jgi:hypothetical protein
MEAKKKKFVGNGRLINLKDSTGFGMNICITDLFEMCMKDPEVMEFVYESEKTGKKYLPLIAWPLKDLKEGEKLRTHAISIDTYKKDDAPSKPAYKATEKKAKEDVFQDSFEVSSLSNSSDNLLSDDDLPF